MNFMFNATIYSNIIYKWFWYLHGSDQVMCKAATCIISMLHFSTHYNPGGKAYIKSVSCWKQIYCIVKWTQCEPCISVATSFLPEHGFNPLSSTAPKNYSKRTSYVSPFMSLLPAAGETKQFQNQVRTIAIKVITYQQSSQKTEQQFSSRPLRFVDSGEQVIYKVFK